MALSIYTNDKQMKNRYYIFIFKWIEKTTTNNKMNLSPNKLTIMMVISFILPIIIKWWWW